MGPLVLASALLLTGAHAHLSLGWLGLVALVPWAYATRSRGIFRGALTGGTIGLLFGLAVSRWIPDALAVRGAGVLPAYLGWLLTALWAGALPMALLCAGIRALDRLAPYLQIPASAALAFAIDSVRSSHVAGVPWALLGHTQAEILGIAQLAVAGGVPLLSALVVAVNLTIARALEIDRTPARIGAALGAVAACGALALAGVPLAERLNEMGRDGVPGESEVFRALLVRDRAPYEERWIPALQRTHLARLALHTERELGSHSERPELIVWPENSLIASLDEDPELRAALLGTVHELGVDVVLGVLSPGEPSSQGRDRAGPLRSQALWVSPERGIMDAFTKTTGVPVVEATGKSPIDRGLRTLFGIGVGAPSLLASAEERPLHGRFEVAVALCYEAIFPDLVAARRTPRTRAILNPSSDAWLADPSLVSRELIAYASFRAIEQRLPLLRIADAGESVGIDPFGRRIATLAGATSGGVWIEVAPVAPPRALERTGLVLFTLAAWATAGLAGALALRRARPRSSKRASLRPSTG